MYFDVKLVFVKDSILGNWPKYERRRRESPPEAKGERSEPFAGGAIDSQFR